MLPLDAGVPTSTLPKAWGERIFVLRRQQIAVAPLARTWSMFTGSVDIVKARPTTTSAHALSTSSNRSGAVALLLTEYRNRRPSVIAVTYATLKEKIESPTMAGRDDAMWLTTRGFQYRTEAGEPRLRAAGIGTGGKPAGMPDILQHDKGES